MQKLAVGAKYQAIRSFVKELPLKTKYLLDTMSPLSTTLSPEQRASRRLQTEADWKVEVTLVKKGVSIGSGATILANVVIGENALIGAGCVVTRDVSANAIVAGNPGRVVRYFKSGGNND